MGGENCPHACGLCPGMKPVRSYTCPDKFTKETCKPENCHKSWVKRNCKGTCDKNCKGARPVDHNCFDRYPNACPRIAKHECGQNYKWEMCKKSCGRCKGMTPVKSNTCFDRCGYCPFGVNYCHMDHYKRGCKSSCGLCK